jgi:hypothetical protein
MPAAFAKWSGEKRAHRQPEKGAGLPVRSATVAGGRGLVHSGVTRIVGSVFLRFFRIPRKYFGASVSKGHFKHC